MQRICISDEAHRSQVRRIEIRGLISEELNPKLSELTNILNGYRVAVGRQKVAELMDSFSDTIIEGSKSVKDDTAIPDNIDIKDES